MPVHFQNLLTDIQGTWHCSSIINVYSEEEWKQSFSLLISENIISATGDTKNYWPTISHFEQVGSAKDRYFYREDGCFIQVRSFTEDQLAIELSYKEDEGNITPVLFHFNKES